MSGITVFLDDDLAPYEYKGADRYHVANKTLHVWRGPYRVASFAVYTVAYIRWYVNER